MVEGTPAPKKTVKIQHAIGFVEACAHWHIQLHVLVTVLLTVLLVVAGEYDMRAQQGPEPHMNPIRN